MLNKDELMVVNPKKPQLMDSKEQVMPGDQRKIQRNHFLTTFPSFNFGNASNLLQILTSSDLEHSVCVYVLTDCYEYS